MKSIMFLRIAGVLSMVHCVLHTIGGVLADPRHGAEEASVIETMKAHHFDMFGSMRTYWDFHFGYGLFATVVLLVEAVLFWQLAGLAKANSNAVRPVLLLFVINCIAIAFVSWRYFFFGPAVNQLLIAVFLGLAVFAAPAVVVAARSMR